MFVWRRRQKMSSRPLLCCTFLALASAFVVARQLGSAFTIGASYSPLRRGTVVSRQHRCGIAATALEVEGDIQPLGMYVLIKVSEAEEMTKGGILLSKPDKPREGVVAKCGPGENDPKTGAEMPLFVKPGAKVLYSKYVGGDALDCGDDSEHRLIRQDDILVTYEGEQATTSTITMPPGRLLVRLQDAKETTDSGILLSKGAVEETTTVGGVVSVGPGEMHSSGKVLPPPVGVGDMVRFKYGDEVELDLGDEGRFRSVRNANCIATWKAK